MSPCPRGAAHAAAVPLLNDTQRKDSIMRVCLFEDARVADLEPLTLTRPAFDLLCGCTTLAEKQARFFEADEVGLLVRPLLAEVTREQRPGQPVNDLDWLWAGSGSSGPDSRAGGVVLVNARWLPPEGCIEEPSGPCVGLVGDEVAYAVLTPAQLGDCSPQRIDRAVERWRSTLPGHPAGGRLVRHLWELVDANAGEIHLDAWYAAPTRALRKDNLPAVTGPYERLMIDPTARIEPMVVADTTNGPVVVDREAVITAFTRLEGPCYIGPRTQVHGAKVRAGTSLGPECRIGGEVEASIVLGHSNKYHEGFLGHAYVGEWVNLGAGTHNSDLRNDYGEVSVVIDNRAVRTGRGKVGCFLGDHTKAGLGVLLNTGTNVGAFCNLLPTGRLLPRYVPSFCSVWNGALTESAAELSPLLETAAKAMRRRGRALSDAQRALYGAILEETAGQRRVAIREAEARRLRRSA